MARTAASSARAYELSAAHPPVAWHTRLYVFRLAGGWQRWPSRRQPHRQPCAPTRNRCGWYAGPSPGRSAATSRVAPACTKGAYPTAPSATDRASSAGCAHIWLSEGACRGE